jgi:hypothetical protein
VLECGVCVGPAWAIAAIVAAFVAQYAPGWLNWPARAAWHVVAKLLLRPLDRFLSSRPDAYLVASTPHVLLAKPA